MTTIIDTHEKTDHRQRARTLLDDALVCDLVLPWTDYGDPRLRAETLPKFHAQKFNLVSLTLATDAETQAQFFAAAAHERAYLDSQSDFAKLIETVDDVYACQKAGKLALSFNLQGTNAFGGNLEMVEVFYKLGVRQALMSYNKKNMAGDGCHERTDSGLSLWGSELVREMNRVGMMVDCSHTGFRTTMDVMETSSAPVIFSHSNPSALWRHDRNINDDQALACAATGGLVGVVGVGIFMGDNDASTAKLFQQIDYYAELIGPSHIGLGLDFVYDVEHMQRYMAGINSPDGGNYDKMTAFFQPEQLSDLVEIMISHGYDETDIRAILGENYMRVARAVWSNGG